MRDMRDLRSPTGVKPVSPAVEAQILNPWTTREVPINFFKTEIFSLLYHIASINDIAQV